jgi:catechol 2,3-dioxygenase-like lactoylglutathione lyase family enzyme
MNNADQMGNVRYMVDDVQAAVDFYTERFEPASGS